MKTAKQMINEVLDLAEIAMKIQRQVQRPHHQAD